jgi:hypothetical protein
VTFTWDPEDLSQYASVIDPLGPGAAQLNLPSGVITGKPRTAFRKPHIVTVAGVRQEGNLALTYPMKISIRRHAGRASRSLEEPPPDDPSASCAPREPTHPLRPSLFDDSLTPTPAIESIGSKFQTCRSFDSIQGSA